MCSCRRLFYTQFSERIFQDSGIVERLRAGIKAWVQLERKERFVVWMLSPLLRC